MPDLRPFGAVSNIVRFPLKDATTGQGAQGISEATTGLIISTLADNEATPTAYTGANLETIAVLGTFAAPTSGKARIALVDDANNPGLIEIQLDDARFAVASSKRLVISVNDGQSTLLDNDYEIELTGPNNAPQMQLADGVPHGGTPDSSTATLSLQSVRLNNPAGDALTAIGSSGYAVGIFNNVSGPAVTLNSSDDSAVLLAFGSGHAPVYDGVLTFAEGILGDQAAANSSSIDLTGISGTPGGIDAMRGATLTILQGASATQSRTITSWDGTALAGVSPPWDIQPSSGDGLMLTVGPPDTPPNFAKLAITPAGGVTVDSLSAAGLATLFTVDSGTTYASAVPGSPVKEIASNAATDVSALALEATAQAIKTKTDSLLAPIRTGTLQAATSMTVTLDSGASAINDFYRDALLVITGGTGAGQARVLNQYNGSTKSATLFRTFYTIPDATSTFAILPLDVPAVGPSGGQVAVGTPQTTIRSSTCQAGGTANTAKLDAGASVTNNLYVGNLLQIQAGAGAGQSRTIVAYNGTTKVATVDRNWITIPDGSSPFAILANLVPTTFSDQGVAQAGAATSITLASTASTTDSLYVGSLVTILSGTGSGQTREVTAYVGSTRVATVDSAWSINPDSTSAYAVIPVASAATPATVSAQVVGYAAGQDPATLVLDALTADHATAGTVGAKLDALTFSTTNVVDCGIVYVNGVRVHGTGVQGDEWGP